jgi:hypothetical protein
VDLEPNAVVETMTNRIKIYLIPSAEEEPGGRPIVIKPIRLAGVRAVVTPIGDVLILAGINPVHPPFDYVTLITTKGARISIKVGDIMPTTHRKRIQVHSALQLSNGVPHEAVHVSVEHQVMDFPLFEQSHYPADCFLTQLAVNVHIQSNIHIITTEEIDLIQHTVGHEVNRPAPHAHATLGTVVVPANAGVSVDYYTNGHISHFNPPKE